MKLFLEKFSSQNYLITILLVGIYGSSMLLFQMELMSLNTELSASVYSSLRNTILSVSYSVAFIMGYVIWLLLGVVFSFSAIIFGAASFELSKVLKISSISFASSATIIIASIFMYGKNNVDEMINGTNISAIVLYLIYIGVIKFSCSIDWIKALLAITTPLLLIVALTYLFRVLL